MKWVIECMAEWNDEAGKPYRTTINIDIDPPIVGIKKTTYRRLLTYQIDLKNQNDLDLEFRK